MYNIYNIYVIYIYIYMYNIYPIHPSDPTKREEFWRTKLRTLGTFVLHVEELLLMASLWKL